MRVSSLPGGREILEATPAVLRAWLATLPDEWLDEWLDADEGPATWSARAVVGHLIEGERSDWLPRVRHLLEHGERVAFRPFDRFAHERAARRAIATDLADFAALRAQGLAELDSLDLQPSDLSRTGRHPEFGVVTLGQHLATWVAHDLSHLAQIARVLARRQTQAVGPRRAYLPILGSDER